MSSDRINQIIEQFELQPHPEGGFYRRIYESSNKILLKDSLKKRSAVTSIYYLLIGNDFSAFHRLDADEIWHYYEGNTDLFVHIIDNSGKYRKLALGSNQNTYQVSVPANQWFSATLEKQNSSNYIFVGCTVSPGFEFDHFELAKKQDLINCYPAHQHIIESLTRL